jgi:DUF438 domain-containing protein
VTESVAETRKETLKELIRDLHEGADPERVKEKLRQALGNATAVEIAQAEEELILEGMPSEEIHRLCDIHLAVFRESLESAKPLAAPGHPVYILMEEHKVLLRFGAELMAVAQGLRGGANSVGPNRLVELESLVENLKDSESHYVREENVLFPYLERHGITQPPAIMWMEHDQIREVKKGLYGLVGNHGSMGFSAFAGQLETVSSALAELLTSHFQKESSILFPAALRVITEEEWTEARQQFDELGYCRFTPEEATGLVEEVAEATAPAREVDKDDRVKYFNQSKERIFPRTRAIIGRRVEQCHPQKSVHIVSRIVEEFRSGRRDVAEFWIDYEGMFVHILYFAVRDRDGQYLGVLEVTQDIMHMKQLEGEKRLLDEADDA